MLSPNPILLKQLNDYKRPFPDAACPRKDDSRVLAISVKLINFEFYPKKIRIPLGSLVRWEVGPNQSVYSSIYNSSERSFFLCIEELDIQSPQLFSGDHFEHRFLSEGVFEIVVLNYSRVKSVVTVYKPSANESINEIFSNSATNLPIFYNRELTLEEKSLKSKEKSQEIPQKRYLDDFRNEFLGQIDPETEFRILENEISKTLKETSESGSKTTEVLDVSSSVHCEITPKKEPETEFKELSTLIRRSLPRDELPPLERLIKIEVSDEEEELYTRITGFLELRHDFTAFFKGK